VNRCIARTPTITYKITTTKLTNRFCNSLAQIGYLSVEECAATCNGKGWTWILRSKQGMCYCITSASPSLSSSGWSDAYQITATEIPFLKTVCKLGTVTHSDKNLAEAKTKINALSWPQGSTLTSMALESARAELSLGRKDSHAIVIVFTDGRPLSKRKTMTASRDVRKVARLVWVPITSYAPLQDIKRWATRRWQENVVVAKTFEDLQKPDVVTHIVANICLILVFL